MFLVKKNYLVLFLCLFFFSCSKSINDSEEIVPEIEPIEISSFVFKKDLNSSLSKDFTLLEDGDTYYVQIPSHFSKKLIPEFTSNATKVLIENMEQKSGITAVDFTSAVKYTFVGAKGGKKEVVVRVIWKSYEIPHISINIDGDAEVTSKVTYLKASVKIEGNELYPSYSGATEIRGRGNSTWAYPKKPYRLKLAAKAEILGLLAAKNWVLLANYIDPSLMCNSVAMKIGRDLELPYTNQMIPVDLTVNNIYRGSYVLTQQVEVGENRINIGKDGVLLELDPNYDEEYKFKTSAYNIPVMLKYPDLTSASQFVPIRTEFNDLVSLIAKNDFPNNNYTDKLNINTLVKYLLVYFITGNEEINHPKSVYAYKVVGDKYNFGPLWDFDWAYGYEGGSHFDRPERPLFRAVGKEFPGTSIFRRLMDDPKVKTAFKNEWTAYKMNKFDDLIRFIDEYAALIKVSKDKDQALWKVGKHFEANVTKLKLYLQNRATYLDTYVQNF